MRTIMSGIPEIKPIEPGELEPLRATWVADLELPEELLSRIKLRRPELKDLLDLVSCQAAYDDDIYRFYHYSYKVYGIQGWTRLIVESLRVIAPQDMSFCPLFQAILKDGFGKPFKEQHNRNWAKHTRPLLEAFFHAKYFLEMAVKSAEKLDSAPISLPYGWAALLELYGIRDLY